MNENSNTLEVVDGIYDILPLSEPAFSLFEITILSLSITITISLIIYILWRTLFSKKVISTRKIKSLHLRYKQNKINDHDAVYELCDITRQGLNLNYLNKEISLPIKLASKKTAWHSFVDQSFKLRYASKSNTSNDLNNLFLDCVFWLKVWP